MLRNYLLLAIFAVTLANCSTNATEDKTTETEANAAMEAQPSYAYFGDTISPDQALTFTKVMNQLESQDSIAVKMRGTVNEVCQAKGCWMNVSSPEMADKAMFVKFKDYGFFVPKDCSGKEAIMEGYAYRELTSVDELRHYAEDEGKSAEEIAAITEPVEELKFMASGVILIEEKQ